jgi:hypothetical protein
VVGGIGAADMAHKGWICQPLQDGLTPFYDSIFNFMLLEKHKDLLGDLMGGIRGGRTRADADPYDDGTKTPLLLLSRRCMGEEVGWVDGQPVNLPSRDQVNNLETHSFPDTIEWGVIDSMKRLDRDMGVSADGLGEGCSEEIRPVNKFRVVPGDAIVVCSPLVLGGGILGDNSSIAGESEGGRHRREGQGALVVVGHRVDAQWSENGKF